MRSILVAVVGLLSSLAAAQTPPPVVINELMASNYGVVADPDFGDYGDWLELYNTGTDTVDLSGFFLTDDRAEPFAWRIPDGQILAPGAFLVIWADDENTGLHTSFRLSADGEEVALYDRAGRLVDAHVFGEQTTDVSIGRVPDGGPTWRFLAAPTPGAPNPTHGYAGVAAPPAVSLPGGFYTGPQTIVLASGDPETVVRYTLDGTPPTVDSPTATAPLTIPSTQVMRAAAFRDGYRPSQVVTQSYFIDATHELPVVSLVTDPAHFFSDETGIYVEGTNGIPGRCRSDPVNWNQEWERPVHVAFYEPDGTLGFAMDAGVQIHGGCTRIYPQKSLALYARRAYGAAKIDYPVFADLPFERYNNLILRSSAQDWWRTLFRDGLIQSVIRPRMDVDGQAYRPAVVYLNGQYWGIHNLREKQNEHYLEAHHGVDPDAVEIMGSEDAPLRGHSAHYDRLLDYLAAHDLNTPESYRFIRSMIDVDAYLAYLVAEIYSANGDWPANNLKLWRPRTPDGRWRWMLFDLDFGFGGNAIGQYDTNNLALATAPDGPSWPNPPWSTYLFRRLLENDRFKHAFLQRLAAHASTTFAPDRVLPIIDSLQAQIASEIPRHKARWPQSMSLGGSWPELVEIMRTFARNRALSIRGHVYDQFDVPGSARLMLDLGPEPNGHVAVYGLPLLPDDPAPIFFRGVPLELTAVPAEGYVFAGWSGLVDSAADTITVVLTESTSLRAAFVPEGTTTAAAPPPAAGADRLGANYPNPVSSQTVIPLTLAETGPVTVTVYDLLGREVMTPVDAVWPAGRHEVVVDAAALANGLYLYEMHTPRGDQTAYLMVAR